MANTEGKDWKRYTSPKHVLEDIEAKGDVKNTLIKSVAQVVVSSVAGSLAGSYCGNWSFLIGPALVLGGNYTDLALLSPLGTGMIAGAIARPKDEPKPAKTDANGKELSGFDLKEELKNAKDRALHWKESFLSRTYLDKVFKKKAAQNSNTANKSKQRTIAQEESPEDMNGLSDAPGDAQTLDEIEKQLIASAMEFQKKQQGQTEMQGVDPDLMGLEEEVDFSRM
jgi:hypothetical protein